MTLEGQIKVIETLMACILDIVHLSYIDISDIYIMNKTGNLLPH